MSMENFKAFFDTQTDVNGRILSIMHHSRIEAEKRFLCAIDKITDYCLSRQCQDEINYNTVFLSCSYESSRQLCMRYLIHKSALSFNQTLVRYARTESVRCINLREGVGGGSREYRQKTATRRYWRNIVSQFSSVLSEGENDRGNTLTLIIAPEVDLNAHNSDRNPWLSLLYNDNINDDGKHNVILTSKSLKEVGDALSKLPKDKIPSIENIFVIHSRNSITSSYNIADLTNINKYFSLGIKNFITFYISERPYRLYDVWKVRETLLGNYYLRRLGSEDYKRFITFSNEELNYIFQRPSTPDIVYKIDDQESAYAYSLIDAELHNVPNRYFLENLLALSIDEESSDLTCRQQSFQGETNIDIFLYYYQTIWKDSIVPGLLDKISQYETVSFIVNDWVDDTYRNSLVRAFSNSGKQISVANYSDFKDKKVTDSCVVFWLYRYTDARYLSYPNSFDPLPLQKDQVGIVVINSIVHKSLYQYNRNKYLNDMSEILCSNFRCDTIGWSPYHATSDVNLDQFNLYLDYNESYEREYQQRIETCRVIYKDKSSHIYPLHYQVLYKNEKDLCSITTLRRLLENESVISGQLATIDELIEQVKVVIDSKNQNRRGIELAIRRQHQYGLTEDQINSNIELWRYLLKRRVDQYGVDEVYQGIFAQTNGPDSINNWVDFDNIMILPRNIAYQNSMFNYLDLDETYRSFVRQKKRITIKDSRDLNCRITSLLCATLLLSKEQIKTEFGRIQKENAEILEIIDAKDSDDLNALVSLLRIDYKEIKQIDKL